MTAWLDVNPAAAAIKVAKQAADIALQPAEQATLAAGASIHACTAPYPPIPHGPGVVVDGNSKVLISNLPACFQGNTIVEALGPVNQIAMGCPQVLIGSD